MYIDKLAVFADDLAFDGTPEELDSLNVRPGPGVPITMYATGENMAGCTGINIRDKANSGDSFATRMTVNFTAAELNAGPIQITLPSNIKRYLTISLAGTATAGTYTAAISMTGIQTAK